MSVIAKAGQDVAAVDTITVTIDGIEVAVPKGTLAIRAAAPAVTALLLATLALGLVGRTLPQLNVLTLGFGANSLLAFAALGLSLGTAAWAFQDQVQPALETILESLKAV